jgi:hypothetical protein
MLSPIEVTMTTTPPRLPHNAWPSSLLVQHDIRLTREQSSNQGPTQVVARVACERLDCDVLVEQCGRCQRFARIETHEAGYVLLCRDHDETPASDDTECPVESEDTPRRTLRDPLTT